MVPSPSCTGRGSGASANPRLAPSQNGGQHPGKRAAGPAPRVLDNRSLFVRNPVKLVHEVPLLVQEGARGWFPLVGGGDVALHAVGFANWWRRIRSLMLRLLSCGATRVLGCCGFLRFSKVEKPQDRATAVAQTDPYAIRALSQGKAAAICCAVHPELGWALTLKCSTRRR
jgi:hypothetical protein